MIEKDEDCPRCGRPWDLPGADYDFQRCTCREIDAEAVMDLVRSAATAVRENHVKGDLQKPLPPHAEFAQVALCAIYASLSEDEVQLDPADAVLGIAFFQSYLVDKIFRFERADAAEWLNSVRDVSYGMITGKDAPGS
jgi:hypothetical protein